LWPRIAPLLPQYPDLHVEFSADYRIVDIAAERFDIGVRHGDQVDKDMIAVRLTPDVQMMIVAAPAYFEWHAVPTTSQELMKHNCINLRLASSGGLYAWELRHDGRDFEAQVRGQTVFTNVYHMLNAALSGVGVTYLPESLVAPYVRSGRLVSVMPDWCAVFPGLHAYYPSRRQASRALALVIDTIRHKG
ncbi:MAG: LysR family transcriptional regulator, partial [Oxalobacteraceae bacterium]